MFFEQFRKFSGPARENDRSVREEHGKCEKLKFPLRFSYVNLKIFLENSEILVKYAQFFESF